MTTQPSAAIEERVSRLEGAYEHLATKADIERLEGLMNTRITQLEVRLLRWMVPTIIGSIGATAAIVRLVG